MEMFYILIVVMATQIQVCVCSVTQLCPTLWDPRDCSLPGSSVHRIFQARILEWVAIFLLQGIFPIQRYTLQLLCLLHWQVDSLPLHHLGNPHKYIHVIKLYNSML